MNNNKRLEFVDIARGISIICIVLGHLGQSGINRIVFTFHVPIFYLISGYFISDKLPFSVFIKKKFKSLIVPYCYTCLAITLLSVLKDFIIYNGVGWKETFAWWIAAALYGAGDAYSSPFIIPSIGAIWFLLACFWACIILRLLLNVKPCVRILSVLFIFIVSCYSTKLMWFPFSIQAAGPALLYMYFGYLFRQSLPHLLQLSREIKFATLIIAVFVWGSFICNFKSFWLVHCDIGRGVIDIIGSLCACGVILFISSLVHNHLHVIPHILSYCGRHSLVLLCMHIIELDVFPWQSIITRLSSSPLSQGQEIALTIILKFIWIIGAGALFVKFSDHIKDRHIEKR